MAETSTQQLIDNLISFIWTTEGKSSVTNVMVARILDWLNRRHKELETLIGQGHDECLGEMEQIRQSIVNLHTALLGVGNTAWNADRKADANEKNIEVLAKELAMLEAWLKNGGSLPGDYTGGVISGQPGEDAVTFSLSATPSAISRIWHASTATITQSAGNISIKVLMATGTDIVTIDTLLDMVRHRLYLIKITDSTESDITTEISGGEWKTTVADNVKTIRYELRREDTGTGTTLTVAALEVPIVALGIMDADRGEWHAGMTCCAESVNPDTGFIETTHVWYKGCKFRCLQSGTLNPPLWNSPDWQMEEGDPTFRASFAETEQIFDPDDFSHTLTVRATLYNQDVTADLDTILWSRYSEDESGNVRTLSDQAWTAAHDHAGAQLQLTAEDCGFYGYIPRSLRFTAKVTLSIPGHQPYTEETSFGY